MDIPPGETVKVWRGPAAGQKKPRGQLDAHLEGGWEQIVVKGPAEHFDTTTYYRRGADGRLSDPIDRDTFMAMDKEAQATYIGL